MRAGPPKRREKSPEEHHLGENEPTHAPAVGQVNLVAILPPLTFSHGFAEPLVQHSEPPQHAEGQGVFAPLNAIDPLGSAKDHKKQPEGGKSRMPRRVGYKIVGCSTVCC